MDCEHNRAYPINLPFFSGRRRVSAPTLKKRQRSISIAALEFKRLAPVPGHWLS